MMFMGLRAINPFAHMVGCHVKAECTSEPQAETIGYDAKEVLSSDAGSNPANPFIQQECEE